MTCCGGRVQAHFYQDLWRKEMIAVCFLLFHRILLLKEFRFKSHLILRPKKAAYNVCNDKRCRALIASWCITYHFVFFTANPTAATTTSDPLHVQQPPLRSSYRRVYVIQRVNQLPKAVGSVPLFQRVCLFRIVQTAGVMTIWRRNFHSSFHVLSHFQRV